MGKCILSILTLGVMLVFNCVTPAFAAPIVLKVGHVQPESDGMHKQWLFFKEQIEKRSNGEIQVQIHPNGELGSDRELTEAVQMGELTMTTATSSPVAAFVADLFILDVPFSFNSRTDVWGALDGELGEHLEKKMLERGLLNLGFAENGFRNTTNSTRPIRTPADLKGIKIRTMENPVHLAAWRALGANPTPMSYGEVFTALQQGTIDGQENPYAQISHMKFFEVQKYCTDTQHLYSVYINFMNREFFNKLSPEHQKLIVEIGREQALFQRKLAEELTNEAEKIIKDSGKTEMIYLTNEERAAFRIASGPALKLIRQRVSPEVVEIFSRLTGIE